MEEIDETFFERAGGRGEGGGPITGENFTEWSERMGEVEEMLDAPDLRSQLGQVRDRARAVRAEYKRHGKNPEWSLVRTQIAGPLYEIRQRINEELARRQNKDSLSPIDRDPVPPQYSEKVKRYYEQLGSSN